MPALDTILFRSMAREDANYFMMATVGELNLPSVRMHMMEKQREIAGRMSCVLDGRDIGTFVLPDADFKFFLTARPEVRAKRRYEELVSRGNRVNFEDILEEIVRRDKQDSTRAVAPLRIADDAILVDTSDMTIDEVVAFIKHSIQEKI